MVLTLLYRQHPTVPLFPHPPSKTQVAMQILECLADISTWSAAHPLKLSLNKTELALPSDETFVYVFRWTNLLDLITQL